MSIFITAEIGINHNGDMLTCKQLIDIASSNGCDAVKFQKRDIEKVYTEEFLSLSRESPWGKTQRDQKMGLEFNYDEYKEIDKYCKDKNIYWYASAWDINSQNFLSKFNTKFNKIASAMIIHEELLNTVASEGKHTFISTGMSTLAYIEKAISIFNKKNCPFELMHSVSTYPMIDEEANLNLIQALRKEFNCNVGYSGHETGLVISLAAAALGATSIERHITIDRTMYGSDQSASLEPNGLRHLVEGIRKIEKCFGDGKKLITKTEIPNVNKLRGHLIKDK